MKLSHVSCQVAALVIAILPFSPSLHAADLVGPSVIAAPLGFNWTGFYVGANIGYGHDFSSWRFPGLAASNNRNGGGLIVGGQLGYDIHLANQFVLGVEGSASWADVRASGACPNPAFSCRADTSIYADASLRLGYAYERFLPYIKGGLSITKRSAATILDQLPNVRATDGPDIDIGYTVGAGVEYAVNGHWSLKAEYNFVGIGEGSTNFIPASQFIPGIGTVNFTNVRQRSSDHLIKVGINYKF